MAYFPCQKTVDQNNVNAAVRPELRVEFQPRLQLRSHSLSLNWWLHCRFELAIEYLNWPWIGQFFFDIYSFSLRGHGRFFGFPWWIQFQSHCFIFCTSSIRSSRYWSSNCYCYNIGDRRKSDSSGFIIECCQTNMNGSRHWSTKYTKKNQKNTITTCLEHDTHICFCNSVSI